MTNEELDEQERESDEIIQNFKEQEKQGVRDILRYYDRIHDKLFSFNNMLTAGYFVIIAIPNSPINPWWIILPICNMLSLVFIDYKMMEKSRFESAIRSKPLEEIAKYGQKINKTTRRSLFTIISTLVVTLVFIIQLLKLV